jgi:hypothetical protein
MGWVAFVRAAAMQLHGASAAALQPTFRSTLQRPDRNEGRLNPGEGLA